ncbi:hypothetical protein BJX99DRAFT_227464 [Aspergillus californicus]
MTIDGLTLAQAASLLARKNFWHTQGIPSHNIPSLRMYSRFSSMPSLLIISKNTGLERA